MYAPTVGPRVGPWESASQWWRIITMIRAAFHGAPVLRERDSRNSRDPRQKEVQKAPQRKKTCNQRVKKQNFHDRCYGSLLPCLVFCVHGIWNNVHSLFLFHLSHFLIRFLFFFFFNEKYQWIIHLNYTIIHCHFVHNERIDIIFIGIKIEKAKWFQMYISKLSDPKKYSKRF